MIAPEILEEGGKWKLFFKDGNYNVGLVENKDYLRNKVMVKGVRWFERSYSLSSLHT